MSNKYFLTAGILCSLVLLQGCLQSDDAPISEQERFIQETGLIDSYLEENNIEAEIDEYTGIRYVVNDEGTGIQPYVVDSVTISYTGTLFSDQSTYASESSAKIAWNHLLYGFRTGVNKIREGGSVTVYIPSYYGYGQTATDNVPANSILIADITLEEVHAQQLRKDIQAIDDSLSAWGIQAEEHPSGIRYILDQGDGDSPTLSNTVVVGYEGRLLGKETRFDSSLSSSFPLSNLILGWQIMLPMVQEGGSITIYIPSSLGYGKNGSGSSIPPNSNLVFEIDLHEVR